MTAQSLGFGVLGTLEMRVGDTTIALGTPKQRAVLAVLVLRRNTTVGMDTLIDAAWEQSPPAGARATLHSYISNLRRVLTRAGIDPRPVLVNVAHGYRLSVSDEHCDVGRFAAEKDAGFSAAAAGRFELASRHLSAALAQWRGPVLDDLRDFSFVNAYASPLVEDKLNVHTAYAQAEIACGRTYSVIAELEELISVHRYREPLWAQLITAYYVTERQSDALDAYRRLKTTLADDLGIDPGPTLRGLHEQILRQQPLDVYQAARTVAEDTLASGTGTQGSGRAGSIALRDPQGRLYPLISVLTRIGRSSDNDIVLDDVKVSRNHAVIVKTGSRVVITDLHSANGIYLHGERIDTSATLNANDTIRIGTYELTLEASAPTASGSEQDTSQATQT
ncbi:BTAD domain-containing putative transcriptional regulator [Mycobacterium bourgelatii]|uniref:Transcriptional regulatory protein EmbR n=1 Tax=Mycobacterium bourgelatii TaxID=1273442 RepID=A0A7I9YHX4_MYCBU|nr:BTAD domain-containing putative transcriptional regulator [Mycobacterium bourgelatii]MCV6976886.1 FHA domain-containing protein [Mycobacterium bourgelatii]GFG88142.1 transcriptional regulatory protein EmbR [Mycobacterium bourgelatii]